MTRTTILAYHAIGDCPRASDTRNLFVSVHAFESQMAYLARRRRVVSLDDAAAGRVPPGPPAVALTFDDGYVSVLDHAAPLLQRYGFPAAVFVPTKWIGRENTWDEPSVCDLRIMGAEQLREVESLGVRVESHGHAHIDYGSAPYEQARADLASSLVRLDEIVGRTPAFFAYPFGRHSEASRRALAESSIEAAFTIDAPGEGRYAYERTQITPLDGPRLFALKTSGRYLAWRHSRLVSAGYSVVRPALRRLLGG